MKNTIMKKIPKFNNPKTQINQPKATPTPGKPISDKKEHLPLQPKLSSFFGAISDSKPVWREKKMTQESHPKSNSEAMKRSKAKKVEMEYPPGLKFKPLGPLPAKRNAQAFFQMTTEKWSP